MLCLYMDLYVLCQAGPNRPPDKSVYWKIIFFISHLKHMLKGAQWLSGRVLDSRPRGRGFEPHRCHCVVVLEQDTFIMA